ncbi:Fxr1 [Symbiodinium microadriaticum]|nr:Fxr1 [Symbiodinium microadriaticum]
MLVEINFKEQTKYQSEMQRLHQMQENLFEVQGEVASGQRIEFQVPMDLIGLIIGKKGSRIHEVQQETDVQGIHIDGNTGRVTIIGPSHMAVQRARELVDVVEERVPVNPAAVPSLQRDFSSMNDIKTMSKCLVAKLSPADSQVVLIGPRSAVASAKLVLDTQLEYITKRVQLYESEKSIRDQLSHLNKRTGAARGGRRVDRPRRGPDGGGLAEHSRAAPHDRGREVEGPSGGAARSSEASGRAHGTDSLQALNGEVRKVDRTHMKEVNSSGNATSAKQGRVVSASPAAAAEPSSRKKQAGSASTNGKRTPQADSDRVEATASVETAKKAARAAAASASGPASSAKKNASTDSAAVSELEGQLSEMKLSPPSSGKSNGKDGARAKAKATGAIATSPVDPVAESTASAAPSTGKTKRGKKGADGARVTAVESPAATNITDAPLPPAPSSASEGDEVGKKTSAPKKKNPKAALATGAAAVAPPALIHTTGNGGADSADGNKKGQTLREARNIQK